MSSQRGHREVKLSWSHVSRREGCASFEIYSLGVVCWIFFIIFFVFGASEGVLAEERNPFVFPIGIQKSGALQKKGSTEKTGQESGAILRVTTILISGGTKVAAINGVLMKKGDKVDGYQILEIEDKQVILAKGNEKQVLKIDPNVGYSFKKKDSNPHTMGFSK